MADKRKTLQFQGDGSLSLTPKIGIIGWYVICAVSAVWLTFHGEGRDGVPVNFTRQVVLLICVITYVARAAITLFVFVKRRVPWWEAVWGGSLIGLVLFFFLREGLRVPHRLDYVEAVGVFLYVAGSYLGTASEYSRHLWKNRPENRGHLYTKGLFRYSRHVNYFGDLLLFTGLAILTGQVWAGFVPLAMGVNFVFVLIPAHDAYLAMRYGAEFTEYAQTTKKLVPLLY